MTYFINGKSSGPFPRDIVLLAAATLAAAGPQSVSAQPSEEAIRIRVADSKLQDHRSVEQIRHRIASAARAVCDPGGLASLHGSDTRRCREQIIAEAETQLRARIATRMAAR